MNDPHQRRELSADLLGYHLDLCDEQDRRRVEAALGDAMSLASVCKKVERILSPLDADESPIPPAGLVASILDRVQGFRNTIPFPKRAAAALPAPMEIGGRGPRFNLRELVGLAAAIALFLGIFVPGYRTARNAAQQAMCANNLRLVGVGNEEYAQMFGGQLPYVRSVRAGESWLPKAGTGIQRFKNSPNVWVLVSNHLVPGKNFVCPGRPQDTPLATNSPEGLNDFPDPRNNSYSTMPVTETWQLRNVDTQMPVAADMTPLVDDVQNLSGNGQVSENSRSHGARGQNVLRGNISVGWFTSPRVGIDNDDIYRLIGVKTYTGQEWPRLRSDAFLIP